MNSNFPGKNKKKKRLDLMINTRGGEQILWQGQPLGGLRLRWYDAFMIPFSLLWCGFACVWTAAVTVTTGPAGICGLPFVAAGLYLVFGRFFAEAAARDKTHYVLTTERVIIVSGLWRQQMTSLSLRTLPEIMLIEGQRGRGTIRFGKPHLFNHWQVTWPGEQRTYGPAFELIVDAPAVYEQILRAQHQAQTGARHSGALDFSESDL